MAKPRRPNSATKPPWTSPAEAADRRLPTADCLVIAAAALALRLLYLWSIADAVFFRHLQANPERYHQWATMILDGPAAPAPPFEQPPAYPYAVAGVYALVGRGLMPVALVQALLGALTCAGLALIAGHWFGRRAGQLAAVLAAVYGPFLYFTGEMVPETLFLAVAVGAVAAATLPTRPRWLLAGTLWASSLLLRANAVLGLPLVLLDAGRRGGRAALLRVTVPIAVVLLLSVTLNARGGGPLVVLTTGGGLNLWLGNNPHADGVSPFVSGDLAAASDEIRAQSGSAAAADRLFRRRVWRFVADDPAAAAALLWKKLLWTFTARELPNNSDIEWKTAHSWLFRLPVGPLGWGAILPLAAAGLTLAPRMPAAWLPLGALAVTGLGTCVIFFTNARFRLIIAPAMIIYAAVALDELPGLIRDRRARWRALLAAALAAAGTAAIAWGNPYDVRSYRIPQIDVNTGILEREAGHLDAATAHLRRGLAAEPRDHVGWIHLALALEQQGDLPGALTAYLDALRHRPDERRLQEMTLRFFDRHRLDRYQLKAYVEARDDAGREAASAALRSTIED
jgi:tetratricopeptide (TPR) repeat protein